MPNPGSNRLKKKNTNYNTFKCVFILSYVGGYLALAHYREATIPLIE